ERIKASPIKELIMTDTVPVDGLEGYPVTILSISELLGEAMLRIHENQSVTSLFQM
ncbi:MAG: ribose-phosphate diphosphokinase, partial [Lentisphaerae bacterium]|nr:ribose-phosphate diphosphokinase [Lentisphaerota bacterium]